MLGLFRKGKPAKGYSGSDTYKYIDDLINDHGKRLDIISPYLGNFYAKMLLEVSTRKKVRLIVSGDSTKRDEDAVRLIIEKGKHVDNKLILFGGIIAVLLALVGAYIIALGIAALVIIYVCAAMILLPKGRKIWVKIATTRFVHEKIYISERRAIVGSANLTYAGTHKNIEHIQLISDEKEITGLRRHFEEQWLKY